MSVDDLERVAAIAQPRSSLMDTEPPVELQVAVTSAIDHGELLAVVAVAADMSSLAVLDAVEGLHAANL